MRGLLLLTRLNRDIPIKATAIGKGLECPNTGGDHAQTAAHEQIPVTHAAHLHVRGLDVADQHAVGHHLSGGHVLGGVDGKLRLVLIQQAAAELGANLVELVVSKRLVVAVNIIAQGADGLSRRLHIILRPVCGGIINAGLVKQVLVVDQHHIGEVAGQAVLLAVHVERAQCSLVQAAEVHTADLGQHALIGIGGEILDVQLIAVRRRAAGHAGLHLGEIVIHGDGFDLNRDVGIFLMEGLVHFLQGFLIAAGRVEVAVSDGHRLLSRLLAGFISRGRRWAFGRSTGRAA